MKVASDSAISNIKSNNYPHTINSNGDYQLTDPNGYAFVLTPLTAAIQKNSIVEVSLFVTNLNTSIDYWSNVLLGKLVSASSENVAISFDATAAFKLNLAKSKDNVINHAKAYGRIAFSCPTEELKPLQALIEEKNLKILTKFISLSTPGKADVCVVILADPDEHEICFVGDKGFRDLSRVDPVAKSLLDEAILNDKSDLWHEKRAKK